MADSEPMSMLDSGEIPEKLTPLPEHSTTPKEREPELEETIAQLEKELGISSNSDRLMEAALFIDKKFLGIDLITSRSDHPERLFGDKAWADWLEARKKAKEYGRRPLTPEFIVDLHRSIAKRSAPEKAGIIRNSGVTGADYTNRGEPIVFTKEQVAAIKENPYLQYIAYGKEGDKFKGKIQYPSSYSYSDTNANRELMLRMLGQLTEWYNQERLKPEYDPYTTAADLQRRFISIHPFGDNNGRVSRLLMNWSLENDNCNPSILLEPGDDILISEQAWRAQVADGSQYTYELLKKRKEALETVGVEDGAFLLDLDEQKTFYSNVYKFLNKPTLPERGQDLQHKSYETFWIDLEGERRKFMQTASDTTHVNYVSFKPGKYESAYEAYTESSSDYTQGGLISETYIQLVRSGRPMPELLQNSFFNPSVKIFRGGISSRLLSDQDLCRMFGEYVGIGTGYLALEKSYTPAISPQKVGNKYIADAIEEYNRVLAIEYLKQRTKDEKVLTEELTSERETLYNKAPKSLADLILIHSGGDSHKGSPWASFCTSESESRYWGKNFSDRWSDDPKPSHGIVIEANAPYLGSLLTFGTRQTRDDGFGDWEYSVPDLPLLNEKLIFLHPNENEVLIAGGADPNSITKIDLFSSLQQGDQLARTAKLQTIEGVRYITIDHYDTPSQTRQWYRYDEKTRQFTMEREEPIEKKEESVVDNSKDDTESEIPTASTPVLETPPLSFLSIMKSYIDEHASLPVFISQLEESESEKKPQYSLTLPSELYSNFHPSLTEPLDFITKEEVMNTKQLLKSYIKKESPLMENQ